MKRFPVRRNRHAFSLVEVTLALGIAVFCMVVVFGLLTVGLNTSAISVEQTSATNVLSIVANDLRTAPKPFPQGSATPSGDGTYHSPIFQLPVPAALAAATASPSSTPAYGTPTKVYLDLEGNFHDSGGNPLTQTSPTARYLLTVWLRPGLGRDAAVARVLLSWPATVDYPNAAGSVETLVAMDRN